MRSSQQRIKKLKLTNFVLGLVCIIHIGDGKDKGNIKSFVHKYESWQKVQQCAEKRKSVLSKSKYDEVLKYLPKTLDPEHGYHSNCYSKFTSIPNKEQNEKTSPSSKSTRSLIPSPPSKSNVLPAVCIFCDQKRKKYNGKWVELVSAMTVEVEKTIRAAAKEQNDQKLLLKIGNYEYGEGKDFTAMEVKYHHQPCKSNYVKILRIKKKGDATETIARKESMAEIIQYTKEHIIEGNNPMHVSEILERYKKIVSSKAGSCQCQYNVQNLSNKLTKEFPNTLEIKSNATKKLVACKKGMSLEEASTSAISTEQKDDKLMWECALKLRKEILDLKPEPLEEPLTVDDILKGEVKIPDSVNNFFTTLYVGNNLTKNLTSKKQRLIDSTAADAVFCCSGGKLLPGKHTSLA